MIRAFLHQFQLVIKKFHPKEVTIMFDLETIDKLDEKKQEVEIYTNS
jgi:hypothetical protein